MVMKEWSDEEWSDEEGCLTVVTEEVCRGDDGYQPNTCSDGGILADVRKVIYLWRSRNGSSQVKMIA